MSLFDDPEDPTELGLDHQAVAAQVLNAFNEHDLDALAALTPAERAAHAQSRQLLYDHLDTIWQQTQLADSGVDPTEVGAVAAVRDLTGALWNNALNAAHLAGDPGPA